MIDGRTDLRGFVFPDPLQMGDARVGGSTFRAISAFPEFERVHWRDIDFSGAVMRNARFTESTIERCLFTGADLFDWRLWGSRILDTSFQRADLAGSAIGTGPYRDAGINIWARVDFDRANMSNAVASECVFLDCSFRRSKLRGVWFTHVTFDGVVFEGVLQRVKFAAQWSEGKRNPGPMRNADFRGVRFRDVDIRYRFENVVFDDTDDIPVIRDYRTVLTRALEMARASRDPRENAQVDLLEVLADHAGDYDTVLVTADFRGLGYDLHEPALVNLVKRAQGDAG
ncbi:pentapeptide repeat-containing protein [Salinibacterium sp. SYSU T00001]|uniref:pentapeptide repeat-containing protein n=1 Tax=Homoserinimonas sedimenticola TaxID=2986805 RepID=UPI00223613E6|nr:pentapeptide repeat-containing protein [Salinibacterium sedimenticola]MCW4384193.1 pentapeptide repeat-containing protein [Salinibacterium sedimenticola]